MPSKPRAPTTRLCQVVPSIAAPPIGAPLADPLAEWEKAAERAERWAAVTHAGDRATAPDYGRGPQSANGGPRPGTGRG